MFHSKTCSKEFIAMKITSQLRWSVIGLAGVAFVSSVLAGLNMGSLRQDGVIVNKTGLVRGGGQRFTKLVLTKKSTDELVKTVDATIDGLLNGSKELELPKAKTKEFAAKLQEIKTEWNTLKQAGSAAQANPALQANLLEESEAFFTLTNEASTLAEEISINDVHFAGNLRWVILLVQLAALGYVWFIVMKAAKLLQGTVGEVASTSTQIASTLEQQERILAEQATSVSETTTTIEELGASSRQAAEQADASSAGAQQALQLSDTGSKTVAETMAGIEELGSKVTAIAEQIMRLSEQTDQISVISDLVADIANQTNMLSLNAAVEAARAGEQGKGFAVVAGEIRKLADQSKQSAEKIQSLVTEIQSSINSTVMVTDEGTKQANAGVKLAQSTAEAFSGVAGAINNVFLNSQQIALSAKQQAVAVQQVISAMNAINLGAKETATGVTQVKASTSILADSAKNLSKTV
jgi:methyl-accepting chemotaxis protein